MLKLRSIGLSDYSALEGRQRIGWIRSLTICGCRTLSRASCAPPAEVRPNFG